MGAESAKIPAFWGKDLNGVDGSAALTPLPDKPITSATLIGKTPEDIRRAAVDWAKSQIGSTDYQIRDASEKIGGDWRPLLPWGLGGVAAPKCNIFIGDAFAKAGIQVDNPVSNGAPYPGAKEWGDTKVEIPGFRVLGRNEKLQPGDIMTDSHHVGIYTPGRNGEDMTISAAAWDKGDAVVHNDWGFRGNEGPMTVRRFTGMP